MKLFLYEFLLFFIIPVTCFCQIEQGFTVRESADSCEVFYTSEPISIPLIRSDMPGEVSLGFLTLDTLCRTYTLEEIQERLPLLSDDSLLMAWHILNRAADYDPYLLEYQHQTEWSKSDTVYKTHWYYPLLHLNMEYYRRFKGISWEDYLHLNRDTLDTRCHSVSGIYLLRPIAHYERSDTGFAGDTNWIVPCTTTTHCMDCEILSVYKGMYHYSACNPSDYELSDDQSCIRVSWNSYTCDTRALETLTASMELGTDYLTFIEYYGTGGYGRKKIAVMKRFAVENGYLYDPEEYFQLGETVPFQNIENILTATLRTLNGK